MSGDRNDESDLSLANPRQAKDPHLKVGRRVPATAFRGFNVRPFFDAAAGTCRPTLFGPQCWYLSQIPWLESTEETAPSTPFPPVRERSALSSPLPSLVSP